MNVPWPPKPPEPLIVAPEYYEYSHGSSNQSPAPSIRTPSNFQSSSQTPSGPSIKADNVTVDLDELMQGLEWQSNEEETETDDDEEKEETET